MAVPILAIGLITVLLAFVFRARVEAVQRMEQSALADAGVDSYLGYVVGRVNDMMDDTEARRRRLAVAEDHRAAAMRWTRLAGDVSVEWALAHHEEIETAARLRRELSNLGQISTTAPGARRGDHGRSPSRSSATSAACARSARAARACR